MTRRSDHSSSMPPRSRIPPSSASPPRPVVTRACRARRAAVRSSRFQPINKNELTLVSSQKINMASMLSESTTPSIADAKNPSVGKNLRRLSSSLPKYALAYSTIAAPMPAMSAASCSSRQRSGYPTSRDLPATTRPTIRVRPFHRHRERPTPCGHAFQPSHGCLNIS